MAVWVVGPGFWRWLAGVWLGGGVFLGVVLGGGSLPENAQGHSEYHAACGGVVSFFSFSLFSFFFSLPFPVSFLVLFLFLSVFSGFSFFIFLLGSFIFRLVW